MDELIFFYVECITLGLALWGYKRPIIGILNLVPAIGIVAYGAIGMGADVPSQMFAVFVALAAVTLPLIGYSKN